MSSSRISLHDCSLSLRLPILSHTTSKLSPEKIAVHAAATPTLDHTRAYTGSALLVLLTVSLPFHAQAIDRSLLNSFIHDVADPKLFLSPKDGDDSPKHSSSTALTVPNASTPKPPAPTFAGKASSTSQQQSRIGLPVLAESTWCTPSLSSNLSASTSDVSASSNGNATAANGAGANNSPPSPTQFKLIKAVWILVRAPPEQKHVDLQGPHELSVELREKSSSSATSLISSSTSSLSSSSNNKLINSAVSATILRASKLFARTSSVVSRKEIEILSPIMITGKILMIGQSNDRPYFQVEIENITQDSNLTVTQPFFHLNNCRKLSRRKSVTLVEPQKGIMNELDRLFKPIPLCTENYHFQNSDKKDGEDNDDEEKLDEFVRDGKKRKWINSSFGSGSSSSSKKNPITFVDKNNTHGIAFPEFNPSSPPVALLNPRDIFVFVFRLEKDLQQQQQQAQSGDVNSKNYPANSKLGSEETSSFIRTKTKYKGILSRSRQSSSSSKQESSKDASVGSSNKRSLDITNSSNLNDPENIEMMDRLICDMRNALSTGDVIQTDVSVAWSCSRETDAPIPDAPSLRRELSAGGVLVTRGKRANVAVGTTVIEWRPVALLDGIVVSVSGSNIINVGKTIHLKISISNHTGHQLNSVKLLLQQPQPNSDDSDDGTNDNLSETEEDVGLLALRTAVDVGKIPIGDETQVRIPCIALRTGIVRLGSVCVVCEIDNGDIMKKWMTEHEFKTMSVLADADQRLDIQSLEHIMTR